MNLCVIPARGGSKRIPKKNIKLFCGKPMIVWSIEAALKSGCFDKVIVSTDDAEISKIANNNGAEVPFCRPKELSDDYTGTTEVVAHAIEWYQKNFKQLSNVCCIYATAPFVEPKDLHEGLEVLKSSDSEYIFSATNYSYPIHRSFRVIENNRVEMFAPENFNIRSQDFEKAYHDAGQFYWGTKNAWLNNRPIFTKKSSVVLLPRYRVQDIDTPDDWKIAEAMFEKFCQKKL